MTFDLSLFSLDHEFLIDNVIKKVVCMIVNTIICIRFYPISFAIVIKKLI